MLKQQQQTRIYSIVFLLFLTSAPSLLHNTHTHVHTKLVQQWRNLILHMHEIWTLCSRKLSATDDFRLLNFSSKQQSSSEVLLRVRQEEGNQFFLCVTIQDHYVSLAKHKDWDLEYTVSVAPSKEKKIHQISRKLEELAVDSRVKTELKPCVVMYTW